MTETHEVQPAPEAKLPQTWVRKPFEVEAVRVTEENMAKAAEWCMGDIYTQSGGPRGEDRKYVRVRVHNPVSERQTKAFVGDWILYAGRGYKVYTNKAFLQNFVEKDPVTENKVDFAQEALRAIFHKDHQVTSNDMTAVDRD